MPLTVVHCGRYELITYGELPVKLSIVKNFLKVDNDVDDVLINNMLINATLYCEGETGRATRINEWKFIIDEFGTRIQLRKSPVDTVTLIQYTKDSILTTVPAEDYYVKKGHHFSDVLLMTGESWPTDGDDIEAGIEITFITSPYRELQRLQVGIMMHVAALYANRGDANIVDAAESSGAKAMYNEPGLKVVRV